MVMTAYKIPLPGLLIAVNTISIIGLMLHFQESGHRVHTSVRGTETEDACYQRHVYETADEPVYHTPSSYSSTPYTRRQGTCSPTPRSSRLSREAALARCVQHTLRSHSDFVNKYHCVL